MFSGQLRGAVGAESALPKFHTHGPSLAADFPAPIIVLAPDTENDDVERSAWRGSEHQDTRSVRQAGFQAVLKAIADA